jgi:predicted RNase H-like HicB family nuclease
MWIYDLRGCRLYHLRVLALTDVLIRLPEIAGVSCVLMQAIDVQTVVFREGKHYVAQCLDVDVSSFGDSEDDALANLREALELYFEDAPADSVAKVEGPEVRRLTLQRA